MIQNLPEPENVGNDAKKALLKQSIKVQTTYSLLEVMSIGQELPASAPKVANDNRCPYSVDTVRQHLRRLKTVGLLVEASSGDGNVINPKIEYDLNHKFLPSDTDE